MVSLLECEGRSQLLDKADQIARRVIEVTPPSDALVRERTARLKTIPCLFVETLWYTAQQIHDLQPRPRKNPSAPASDWKGRGKICAVSWDGKGYFPAYQFSEAVQPLPVIAEVLAQFGEVADTWQIAACQPRDHPSTPDSFSLGWGDTRFAPLKLPQQPVHIQPRR